MRNIFAKGICLTAVLLLLNVGGNAIYVNAADVNMKIYSQEREDGKIFTNDDGVWSPGEEKAKGFCIENVSNSLIEVEKLDFGVNYLYDHINDRYLEKGTKEYNDISKNITVKVTNEEGKILYEDSLKKISKKGINFKGDLNINSKDKKELKMNISVNGDMGNEGQGVEADIDMGVYYLLNEGGNLPYTGGKNSLITIGIGILMMSAGILLLVKRKVKS